MVVGYCKKDCCYRKLTSCSIDIQRDDSVVTIGTRDYGFTVPKDLIGKNIIVQGTEPGLMIRERRPVRKDAQKDIQFIATGVKVLD